MCRNLVPNVDRPENTKCDISSFAKELAVVVAVVLSWDTSNSRKRIEECAYIDKSGWAQEEVVLLHGFGMNDTKVPSNVTITHPCPLEVSVLLISEISHRSLELSDDSAGGHITGSEDTQFRLARLVRVTRCVGDFDGT